MGNACSCTGGSVSQELLRKASAVVLVGMEVIVIQGTDVVRVPFAYNMSKGGNNHYSLAKRTLMA